MDPGCWGWVLLHHTSWLPNQFDGHARRQVQLFRLHALRGTHPVDPLCDHYHMCPHDCEVHLLMWNVWLVSRHRGHSEFVFVIFIIIAIIIALFEIEGFNAVYAYVLHSVRTVRL